MRLPSNGLGSPGRGMTGWLQLMDLAEVLGDRVPLGWVPPLGGADDGEVLADVHERREPLQAEALDHGPVGVDQREPAIGVRTEEGAGVVRVGRSPATPTRQSASRKLVRMRSAVSRIQALWSV